MAPLPELFPETSMEKKMSSQLPQLRLQMRPLNVPSIENIDPDLHVDLECPVCFQLFCEPVRWQGGCGHVFCKICLYRCAQRFAQCPVCRCHSARTPIELLEVDEDLKTTVRSLDEQSYTERLVETMREVRSIQQKTKAESTLMFFRSTTIQAVLPQGPVLVLRFTEARYKWMVKRAMGDDAEYPPHGPLYHFGIIGGRTIEEGSKGLMVQILSNQQTPDGVTVTIRVKSTFCVDEVYFDAVPGIADAPPLQFGRVRLLDFMSNAENDGDFEMESVIPPRPSPPRWMRPPRPLHHLRRNLSYFLRRMEHQLSPSPTSRIPYLPSISR